MPEVESSEGAGQDDRARARAAREALVGQTVAGKYALRAVVGHGGMGAVYEAEHLGIGKRVAIKFVDPEFATDEQVVARFAREARAMSTVESAHIVTVFDAGTEGGRPYLVMELLRGEDLGQRLRRTRRVPLGESLHVIAQVLKGLARAHRAGIVHRDLKPDNVFLTKTDTDPLFAKIVDFGISKIERPKAATTPLALTGRGTIIGTPLYMSPEQAQCAADVDGRADLYSAGAILFECLSGRPPHTGESYEQVILSIVMRDAPKLRAIEPSVPEEVERFLERALARAPAQRFASAERMLAALHEIAPEERTRVPLEPPAPMTLVSAGAPTEVMSESPVAAALGTATKLGMAVLDGKGALVRTKSPDAAAPDAAGAAGAAAPEASPSERALGRPALARAVNLSASDPALAAVRAAVPGAPSEEVAAPPAKRRLGATVMTAALATLTGVAVTLGVVYASGRKDDEAAHGIATSSSAPVTIASAGRDRDPDPAGAAATGGGASSAAPASPASTLSLSPLSPLGPSSAAPSPSSSGSAAQPPSGSPSAALSAAHAHPHAASAAHDGPPKPRSLPGLPPSGGAPPRAPAKPLDINRDLP